MHRTDLEEELKQAYAALPEPARRPNVLADAQGRARRQQHRRALTTTLGAGGAVAAITALALLGGSLRDDRPASLPVPAGTTTAAADSTPTPSGSAKAPQPTPSSFTPDSNRRVHGVAGYLLPHGSQLPPALSYRLGSDKTKQPRKSSTIDGDDNTSFLSGGVIWAQDPGAGPASTRPRSHQPIAGAEDGAVNRRPDGSLPGDGDPSQRSLLSAISRFSSPEGAAGAFEDLRKSVGPWRWNTDIQRTELTWVGTGDGASYLYALRSGHGREHLAVQFVGPFIVSAKASDATQAQQAVIHMVANLRAAKLVK